MRVQIDGQLVAHYIYSAKELEALRKGGVQRLYVGNVTTGEHGLDVLVDGKLANGTDFNRNEHFAFRKDVKPKLVGLTIGAGAPLFVHTYNQSRPGGRPITRPRSTRL